MQAKDIMTTNVVTASPSMTLKETAALLADHGIMGAPVVNAAGFLVGVISQTDLVRHEREKSGGTPNYYVDPETRERLALASVGGGARVKDLMTPLVISAGREDDVFDVARMMIDQRIHRVIIAEDNKLYGIVTTTDLLKAFLALFGRAGRSSRRPRTSTPGPRARHRPGTLARPS